MKKRTLFKIGGLAVVLCLITTCLLSTTLAKYVTTVTGTGTATVAAWSFKANNQSETMTAINLADTVNTNTSKLATGKIAPGTSGSFAIEIDPTGSETGVAYTIAFTGIDASEIPTNLKFYSDDGFASEYQMSSGFTGTINLPVGGSMTDAEKKTETVYWKWPYYTPDGDAADTADQNKDVSFTITVTGTQVAPSP